MTVRGAIGESRTVSRLRGSSGTATGYSEPPMLPRMRCPRGRSGMGLGSNVAPKHTCDGVAVIFCHGSVHAQSVVPRRIPLPPQSSNRITIAQEPAVPGVVTQIVAAALDHREYARLASVRHFQQHFAVSARRILGTDDHKIRPELTSPFLRLTASSRSTMPWLCL